MARLPRSRLVAASRNYVSAPLDCTEPQPDYVNAVRKLYPEVPGMADYCVFWFNRAHHHLPECTAERPEIGADALARAACTRTAASPDRSTA